LIAVGIDISKYKSKVAILNNDCSIRAKPFDMNHNQTEMNALVQYLKKSK
jgi:hypothetical protein